MNQPRVVNLLPVVPAQAGAQVACADTGTWIPAFAGMTARQFSESET